jgi:alpha-beta hydrolase superfamily lysophospholipase
MEAPMQTSSGGRLARAFRVAAATLFTLGALLALVWWAARPATPDAFYTWTGDVPASPGTLLRTAPFTLDLPEGARGWLILYTTTRADGTPAVASAVVTASATAAAEPRPVIAWAHGTTGIEPGCAPSIVKPFANVPALPAIIEAGWVYVATDYPGLGTSGGHAYLAGEGAANAVLDAVRAARSIPEIDLDNRTVVWGHSQGGNTALWTGQRAQAYAPDVPIAGIAALAPASDLRGLVDASRTSMFGKIVSSYLVAAYGAAYPEVASGGYVHEGARKVTDDIAARCVGGWPTLVSAAAAWLLPEDGIFARDPLEGPLGARLAENTPAGPFAVPVLIAQGESDDLVLPKVQQRYVESRCATGQAIDYRTYPGRDHISLVAGDSSLGAELITWSRERFEGKPALGACR